MKHLTAFIQALAHNRYIMIRKLFGYRLKARIRRQDNHYVITNDRGELLIGGVEFPSADVAREYLNTSRLLKV